MSHLALSSSVLVFQGVAAALVMGAVTAAPPARGVMLILPLTSGSRPAIMAIRTGARLVSAGPVSGSMIVRGDRNRIVPAAFADGDIVIASGTRGCTGPGSA